MLDFIVLFLIIDEMILNKIHSYFHLKNHFNKYWQNLYLKCIFKTQKISI